MNNAEEIICDVCNEPIADDYICQDEYRSEYYSGDLER